MRIQLLLHSCCCQGWHIVIVGVHTVGHTLVVSLLSRQFMYLASPVSCSTACMNRLFTSAVNECHCSSGWHCNADLSRRHALGHRPVPPTSTSQDGQFSATTPTSLIGSSASSVAHKPGQARFHSPRGLHVTTDTMRRSRCHERRQCTDTCSCAAAVELVHKRPSMPWHASLTSLPPSLTPSLRYWVLPLDTGEPVIV